MNEYCYQDEFPTESSMESRRKKDIGDIYLNQAKCLRCNQMIVSMSDHDFVTCSCGNLSCDGGSWYAKRSYKTNLWEECSIYYTDRYKL